MAVSPNERRRKKTHGNFKHGFSTCSSEYTAWCSIKTHCYNKKSVNYKNYGGKGIRVCDRWIDSFANFLVDMGVKPSSNHYLKRIDINKNYELNNCKWIANSCYLIKSKKRYIKHNGCGTSEYRIWASMKSRCYNTNDRRVYRYYGGRGIKICARWVDSFTNFLADMGKRPSSKHSLDRIDNNGHYEPSNCRWATRKEQLANRRKFAAITNFTDTELIAELERRGYQVAKKPAPKKPDTQETKSEEPKKQE